MVLSRNKTGDEGCKNILHTIAHIKNLTNLKLGMRDNGISDEGLAFLCRGIRKNNLLQCLCLYLSKN